jgi:hypothetical protein
MPESTLDYNDLSRKIHDILAKYSHFPEPILVTQCKRLGKTPRDLSLSDLPQLAEFIKKAISNFSNPQRAEEARLAILNLGK